MSPARWVEDRLWYAMHTVQRGDWAMDRLCPLRRNGEGTPLRDPINAMVIVHGHMDHKIDAGLASEADAACHLAALLLGIEVRAVRLIAAGWAGPGGSWKDDTGCEHTWMRVGARLSKEFHVGAGGEV